MIQLLTQTQMFPQAVFIGAIVQLLGGVAYIRDTLYGETKPNRVTWFLWTLAPYIGTAAAISDGVGWAVLPVFMVGFVPMCVLIASFINKNAYWQLGWFDYFCGAVSILALVLWVITKEPVLAVIFAVLADALAALPTLIKAWEYPETETAAVYTAALFGALTAFLALKTWGVSEYLFPAYLVLINSAIVLAIYRRKFWAI